MSTDNKSGERERIAEARALGWEHNWQYERDLKLEAMARATAAEARIEQAYKSGFDFAMLTNSADADLAAENARLREALMDAKDALVAAEVRDDQARFRANTPRQDVEVRHLRASAIDKARAALSQEPPK